MSQRSNVNTPSSSMSSYESPLDNEVPSQQIGHDRGFNTFAQQNTNAVGATLSTGDIDPTLLSGNHNHQLYHGYPPSPTPAAEQIHSPFEQFAQPTQTALEHAFWNAPNFLEEPGLGYVAGTNAELFQDYPDYHYAVWREYEFHLQQQTQDQLCGFDPAPTARPAGNEVRETDTDNCGSGAFQAEVPAQAEVPVQSDEPAAKKSKKRGRPAKETADRPNKKARNAVAEELSGNISSYTRDPALDSPAACRKFLAYVDLLDAHKPEIDDDDLEDVEKNRSHDFIGGIFDALSVPAAPEPPAGAKLTDGAKEKYREQQDKYYPKVINLLQTPAQVKAAKAQCSLLYEAATLVHQRGVRKEVWENHQSYVKNGRKVARDCRLDLKSTCSERLLKIVEIVKAHKLVAHDVLTGSHFRRIAEDPGYYLSEKLEYLISNETRQHRYETLGENKEAGASANSTTKSMKERRRGKKEPQRAKEDAEESTEEVEEELERFSDETYEPPGGRS